MSNENTKIKEEDYVEFWNRNMSELFYRAKDSRGDYVEFKVDGKAFINDEGLAVIDVLSHMGTEEKGVLLTKVRRWLVKDAMNIDLLMRERRNV